MTMAPIVVRPRRGKNKKVRTAIKAKVPAAMARQLSGNSGA
jgi:hypothetical protein